MASALRTAGYGSTEEKKGPAASRFPSLPPLPSPRRGGGRRVHRGFGGRRRGWRPRRLLERMDVDSRPKFLLPLLILSMVAGIGASPRMTHSMCFLRGLAGVPFALLCLVSSRAASVGGIDPRSAVSRSGDTPGGGFVLWAASEPVLQMHHWSHVQPSISLQRSCPQRSFFCPLLCSQLRECCLLTGP